MIEKVQYSICLDLNYYKVEMNILSVMTEWMSEVISS